MFDRNQTVASVVLEHSECAAIFQRNRIDFCCRGNLSIEAAAQERGIAVEPLLAELRRATEERQGEPQEDLRALSTPRLIARIITKHHEYLRQAMPFIQALASKVSRVHGEHNPKLRELHAAVEALAGELIPHLETEEVELFPALTAKDADPARIAPLLAAMQAEHLGVAALLERIRAAADDFTLPDWACNSYRTLSQELKQLESDTFAHVYLENHVLQPRFAPDGRAS
jgi:regulator of cell morphogenesis and NO signaling